MTEPTTIGGVPEPLPPGIRPCRIHGELVGWLVRLQRRGRAIARNFRVGDYPDLGVAFCAAKHFIEEVDRAYPQLSSRERGITLRSDNTSGVPGVSRGSFRPQEHHWMALVEIGGRKRSKTFSVRKYGEEEAFRLAVEARRTLLAAASMGDVGAAEPDRDTGTTANGKDDLLRAPAGSNVLPNPYATFSCEVRGVFLRLNTWRRKDGTVTVTPRWVAAMNTPDGRYLRRHFSVPRFGDETARRMAIEQRRIWEAESTLAHVDRNRSAGSVPVQPRDVKAHAGQSALVRCSPRLHELDSAGVECHRGHYLKKRATNT